MENYGWSYIYFSNVGLNVGQTESILNREHVTSLSKSTYISLHYFDHLTSEGHFLSEILMCLPTKKTKKPVNVYPDLGDRVMGVVGD